MLLNPSLYQSWFAELCNFALYIAAHLSCHCLPPFLFPCFSIRTTHRRRRSLANNRRLHPRRVTCGLATRREKVCGRCCCSCRWFPTAVSSGTSPPLHHVGRYALPERYSSICKMQRSRSRPLSGICTGIIGGGRRVRARASSMPPDLGNGRVD